VVENDIEISSLRALKFSNCPLSFSISKARYYDVITGDSEESKWLSFLASSITSVTILLIEKQSIFIFLLKWKIFSTSPAKLGM
jgi:hypothetical protein